MQLVVCLFVVLSCLHHVSRASHPTLRVRVSPPFQPLEFKEGIKQDLTVRVELQNSTLNATHVLQDDFTLYLFVKPEVEWRLKVISQNPLYFNKTDIVKRTNKTFTIIGEVLGYSNLTFYSVDSLAGLQGNNGSVIRDGFRIVVLRYLVLMDKVFLGIIIGLVSINHVNMGCTLDLRVILAVLRKPIGPVVGFLCQFLIMPLLSFGTSLLLIEEPLYRLGLFALGCSPGGTSSNFWTLLLDGDVNLSVVMTMLSTIAALGMLPLWMYSLGPHLYNTQGITIPYDKMILSLIALSLPLGIGILIKAKKPSWASVIVKMIKPITLLIILVIMTVGIYNSLYVFYLLSWGIVGAGLITAWGGFFFGAFFAWLFKLERKQIIAVSIETAFQNAGVAFLMLRLSLTEPDGDLASVSCIAQLSVVGPPLWVALLLLHTRKRISRLCYPDDPLPVTPVPLGTVNLAADVLEDDLVKGRVDVDNNLDKVTHLENRGDGGSDIPMNKDGETGPEEATRGDVSIAGSEVTSGDNKPALV